jgi:hypothetical protein
MTQGTSTPDVPAEAPSTDGRRVSRAQFALQSFIGLGLLVAVISASSSWWLTLPGVALVDVEPLVPADAAVVLEGSGLHALERAEEWRQLGIVRRIVMIEAPIKTHALVTYWSDLVNEGMALPAPVPAAALTMVKSPRAGVRTQLEAAVPALRATGSRSILVLSGAMGSRLTRREVQAALGGSGFEYTLVLAEPPERPPSAWYQDADDRRHVLGAWLQLLIPFLSNGD